MERKFELVSNYPPKGDQPNAIHGLTTGIKKGCRYQTLLGVTGSGKTFTMANIIYNIQLPTLVVSHNKTLAAQLYSEFKKYFPNNRNGYGYIWSEIIDKLGDKPIDKSIWLLMTKDVLQGSRNKSYSQQKNIVAELAKTTGVPYQVPTTLEAATCILAEYSRSKNLLFSEIPGYTRCQENFQGYKVFVGGFAPAGRGRNLVGRAAARRARRRTSGFVGRHPPGVGVVRSPLVPRPRLFPCSRPFASPLSNLADPLRGVWPREALGHELLNLPPSLATGRCQKLVMVAGAQVRGQGAKPGQVQSPLLHQLEDHRVLAPDARRSDSLVRRLLAQPQPLRTVDKQ